MLKTKRKVVSFHSEKKKGNTNTNSEILDIFSPESSKKEKKKKKKRMPVPLWLYPKWETIESLISKQTGKNVTINRLKMTVFKHSPDPTQSLPFTTHTPNAQILKIKTTDIHLHILKDSNSTKCIQFKHQKNVGHNKKRQTTCVNVTLLYPQSKL